MATPRYDQRETLTLAAQEWVFNGHGFPGPVLDEMLEHSLPREDLEIVYPLVSKGTFIRVPTWFIELSIACNEKLSREVFDFEVRRREFPQDKPDWEQKYVFPGWEIEFYTRGNATVFFWGTWRVPGTNDNMFVDLSFNNTSGHGVARLTIWEKSDICSICHRLVGVKTLGKTYEQILRELEMVMINP